MITNLLLRIGLIKMGRKSYVCKYNYETEQLDYIYPEQIIFPFHIAPLWIWKHPIVSVKMSGWFYIFRNLKGVIKYREGRLLPIRWGFGIMGLIEFGDRG